MFGCLFEANLKVFVSSICHCFLLLSVGLCLLLYFEVYLFEVSVKYSRYLSSTGKCGF